MCSINPAAFNTALQPGPRSSHPCPSPCFPSLPMQTSRATSWRVKSSWDRVSGQDEGCRSPSSWTWGLSCQETCWRQEGPSCPRGGVLVFAGVCWAGGAFGKRGFISRLGVGGKQSTEPSPGGLCCITCPCPEGVSALGGQRRGCLHRGLSWRDPKATPTGCIAKGNRYREASQEKLWPPMSVAVPGSSLTHGGRCWQSRGAPGRWPAGAGGAGLVARVVRERGRRRAWLVGTSARPRPSSSGREQCPKPGEGWTWRGGCGPGRYWHPRWVVIAVRRHCCMGEILLCLQTLSRTGKKLPVSFVAAAVGALGAARLPSPAVQPC